jgi:hypothetical protein
MNNITVMWMIHSKKDSFNRTTVTGGAGDMISKTWWWWREG